MKRSWMFLLIIFVIGIVFLNPTLLEAQELPSETSVVLVIDTSESMWGTPMNSVKDAARNFVVSLGGDVPIAIATFSNDAQILTEYTTDLSSLLRTISELTPRGVTALYDGTTIGVDYALEHGTSNNIIILLSDGAEYGGQSAMSRSDALLRAELANIQVYSIGLGFGADRSFLEDLASRTNGQFFEAPDVENVSEIYNQLSDLVLAPTPVSEDVVVQTAPSSSMRGNLVTVNDPVILPTGEPNGAGASDETAETASTANTVVTTETDSDTSPVEEVVAVTQIRAEDSAVVLTIDVSQSMWGTPMAAAIEAAQTFVREVEDNVPIALITFSNRAEVILDFTTDKALLLQTINNLAPIGVTALYDGALASVELAAASGAENPTVILLSDGGEYGGQSDAARDDAILIASVENVTINTIAFGFSVDRSYLQDLAAVNNGEMFEASTPEDLLTIYSNLSQSFVANEIVEAVDSAPIAPLSEEAQVPIDSEFVQPEFPLAGGVLPSAIDPLNSEIAGLNIPPASAEDAVDIPVVNTSIETADGTINPADLEEVAVDPISNIVPVNITVADDIEVESAIVSINNFEIARFTEAPFSFDLDTLLLSSGLYNLAVEIRTSSDIISADRIPFEVSVSETAVPIEVDSVVENAGVVEVDAEAEAEQALAPTVAARTLTINGEEQPFNFEYSLVDGLSLAAPVISAEDAMANQTLGDILARPVQFIPEPVLDYILIPRPRMVMIVIILMTIILLPQGFFTIYWMTYTWVNPQRVEDSASPKEFYEPQHSFTALVPARKEAAVIYDTIQTVNNIDYPEHLKETLVLIRDEDDDETIAETHRAINDIRQSYHDRGEAYPDNIKLVTFKTGPKNKPNGLNRGYREATKDTVCIFDAEDQPHHEIYNVINTVMIRDDADVVQSGVQLMNFQSKWFSAFNVLEYFFWFKSGLHAYTHALNVTPLGGNTVFIRKSWLDKLAVEDTEKGYRVWDEEGLTEDADIGLRLTKMGANIQIVYDAIQATREETPDSVEQFIKQRTRWDHGFYQIFRKGLWLQLPTLKQRITAVYILLNSLLQAAIMLFLPVGVFIALTQQVSVPVALLSYLPIYILVFQLMLNMVGIREFTEAYGLKLPFLFRAKMLLFFYPFQLLLSAAAVRAIFHFITNQSAWEKTTHSNLHRQGNVAVGGAS